MSFLDRFRRNQDVEQRDLTSSDAIPSNSDGFGVDAGEYVSDRSALSVVTVFACVRLLADNIASLPMDAFRKQGDLRVSLEPQPSLIRAPLPALTNFDWAYQVVTSLALRGNAYLVVMSRDALEFATELLPVHPDAMQVDRDPDTGKPRYRIGGHQVPNADMLHIRRFPLPGELEGISPIEKARQGIGMALAAERYGARYFGQSANPSAVLETDANLTPGQAKELRDTWITSHAGKRHPAVLSGGIRYRPITVTPEESQFLQTRQFQAGEIAKMFGVPPHMVGDTQKSTSWGSGIEQQSIGFVTYTLRPWLKCIEDSLSTLLPRSQYVRFNVDALLRGDTKARYESYTQARNAGWLNVNEIRALEDRAPVPNGDDYLQPLNMGPLGSDPTKTPEPAAPADEDEEN